MPTFDERFARQYRFDPPSAFQQTSIYAGIVHHLSGPDSDARLKPFIENQGWLAGHALCFHCAHRVAAGVLASMSDSLVRVSRRVGGACCVRRDLASGMSSLTKAECFSRPPRRGGPAVRSTPPTRAADASREATRNRVSSRRVQALFNSLFKVLCIFPSRYLFAIGHAPIFSFRRNLPPTSSCNPKQPDSARAHRAAASRHATGFSPSPIPRSSGF